MKNYTNVVWTAAAVSSATVLLGPGIYHLGLEAAHVIARNKCVEFLKEKNKPKSLAKNVGKQIEGGGLFSNKKSWKYACRAKECSGCHEIERLIRDEDFMSHAIRAFITFVGAFCINYS